MAGYRWRPDGCGVMLASSGTPLGEGAQRSSPARLSRVPRITVGLLRANLQFRLMPGHRKEGRPPQYIALRRRAAGKLQIVRLRNPTYWQRPHIYPGFTWIWSRGQVMYLHFPPQGPAS